MSLGQEFKPSPAPSFVEALMISWHAADAKRLKARHPPPGGWPSCPYVAYTPVWSDAVQGKRLTQEEILAMEGLTEHEKHMVLHQFCYDCQNQYADVENYNESYIEDQVEAWHLAEY